MLCNYLLQYIPILHAYLRMAVLYCSSRKDQIRIFSFHKESISITAISKYPCY